MSIHVSGCPFCDYDDVEITEVSPGEFAVDCPDCRCIGPILGEPMEAIAKWNDAPRRADQVVMATIVPDAPTWAAKMNRDDEAAKEKYARVDVELRRQRDELNEYNTRCAPQVSA